MDLDFSIDYKPGNLHHVPDALSRLPTDEITPQSTDDLILASLSNPSADGDVATMQVTSDNAIAPPKIANTFHLSLTNVPDTVEEWLKVQRADPRYRKLFDENFRKSFLQRKQYNRQKILFKLQGTPGI